jgi:hypothetical protein
VCGRFSGLVHPLPARLVRQQEAKPAVLSPTMQKLANFTGWLVALPENVGEWSMASHPMVPGIFRP